MALFLLASFRLDAQKGYDLLLEALVGILEASVCRSAVALAASTPPKPPTQFNPNSPPPPMLCDFSFPDFVHPADPTTARAAGLVDGGWGFCWLGQF